MYQNYRNGKWAKKILSLQQPDGSWGNFHTLSVGTAAPITTEQALRRLAILGFTIDDDPIKCAVTYMSDCLSGKRQIPDREEKGCDWDIFRQLMLATWIRRFSIANAEANSVAEIWASIITYAFENGSYNHERYIQAYRLVFGNNPHGGRLIDFVSFYQVSLLAGILDNEIEDKMFDYILQHEAGIYYRYEKRLTDLPTVFQSKNASRYIGAIEVLSEYKCSPDKLTFVIDWLKTQQLYDGTWDMGAASKDGVHFPMSDVWKEEARKLDSTQRINALIKAIKKQS